LRVDPEIIAITVGYVFSFCRIYCSKKIVT